MMTQTPLYLSALLLALTVTFLSGCGVAGDPQPPAAKPAVAVTGEARLGLATNG